MRNETLKQDIVRELDRLPGETLREVRDSVEFLVMRRLAETPPDETREEAPDVSLEEVRERLSTMKGSMAKTISDMREDRV